MNKKLFFSLVVMCSLNADESQKWDGNYYDQHSDPQYNFATNYLNQLNLKEYSHIVEVGCGSGRVTEFIAKAVPNGDVTGVDCDASMIESASKKVSENANISFVQAKAEELSLEKSANLIVSFATFQWIEKQQEALKKACENLEDGGEFHMNMTAQLDSNKPHAIALREVCNSEKWKDHFSKFKKGAFFPQTKEKLEKMMKKAGFQEVQITEVPKKTKFENREHYKEWLRTFIDGITGVSELDAAKKEEFLEDIVTIFVRESSDSDGSVINEVTTLLAIGKRKNSTQE